MKHNLFIVDASFHIYRIWYAINADTKVKQHPNVLHGFLGFIRNLVENHGARYICIVFDPEEGETFRQKLYPEYKAQREPCPPDVVEQRKLVKDACWLLGLSIWETPGVEADDIIATLVHCAVVSGHRATIVGNDKDFFQLCETDKIEQLQYRRNKVKRVVTERDVLKAELGVQPYQVASYLALVGDKSDNIPGLPGCGPVNAKKMLKPDHTLNTLITELVHKDKLSKVEQTLLESQDEVRLWLLLTTLDRTEQSTRLEFGSVEDHKPEAFENDLVAFIKEHNLDWLRQNLVRNPNANTILDLWHQKLHKDEEPEEVEEPETILEEKPKPKLDKTKLSKLEAFRKKLLKR